MLESLETCGIGDHALMTFKGFEGRRDTDASSGQDTGGLLVVMTLDTFR